jgi:hypothetical protein
MLSSSASSLGSSAALDMKDTGDKTQGVSMSQLEHDKVELTRLSACPVWSRSSISWWS